MQSLSNATQIAKELRGASRLPEIPTHMMWVLIVLLVAWGLKSIVETWLKHKEAPMRSKEARFKAICDLLPKIAKAKSSVEKLTKLIEATVTVVHQDVQNQTCSPKASVPSSKDKPAE